jgi:TPR repeat protein
MLCSVQFAWAETPPVFSFSSTHKATCDTGDEKACVQYALDLFFALEKLDDAADPADEIIENEFFKASDLSAGCEKNSATACAVRNLNAIMKKTGFGSEDKSANNPMSLKQKTEYIAKSVEQYCQKDAALACLIAGVAHNQLDADQYKQISQAFISKSVALADKDCTNGDKRICLLLGRLYENRTLGERDQEHAQNYFNMAIKDECNTGLSCFEMAQKFSQGERSPVAEERDAGFLAAIYNKACDLGEMRGCTNLARLNSAQYVSDAPNHRDIPVQLYTKACEGGDMLGCMNLGLIDIVNSKDLKTSTHAVSMFTKACSDPKYRRACYIVGNAHYYGTGAPVNRALAKEYYLKSCEDKDQECVRIINQTGRAKDMDITQVMGQTWH